VPRPPLSCGAVGDDRVRRATSFASVAEAYERARPEYPAEAVRWLAGESPGDVVDLAAGTGKLSRVLVRLGHRVTAVEPLPEMLEQLRAAVPSARALAGSAEAVPLADASADAVVAGQAFHWFDAGPALREIARVLRPGGTVGLIWNVRDESVPWVAELSDRIGGERVDATDVRAEIDATGLYGTVERQEWHWRQPLDRERLRDLVLSRSYCASLPDDERQPVLDAVDRLYDQAAGPDGLLLPYGTHAFRAERR
jgi:SAM-dependent methyltransferase